MEFILESYSIGLPLDQSPGCTHHKQGKAANISQFEVETFTKSLFLSNNVIIII